MKLSELEKASLERELSKIDLKSSWHLRTASIIDKKMLGTLNQIDKKFFEEFSEDKRNQAELLSYKRAFIIAKLERNDFDSSFDITTLPAELVAKYPMDLILKKSDVSTQIKLEFWKNRCELLQILDSLYLRFITKHQPYKNGNEMDRLSKIINLWYEYGNLDFDDQIVTPGLICHQISILVHEGIDEAYSENGFIQDWVRLESAMKKIGIWDSSN